MSASDFQPPASCQSIFDGRLDMLVLVTLHSNSILARRARQGNLGFARGTSLKEPVARVPCPTLAVGM
jgi:hypothetical protein